MSEPIWTDDECFSLNAGQHDSTRHPYTCGNDSRHRPLIATRFGWRCADCDYRQGWAHGVGPRGGPPRVGAVPPMLAVPPLRAVPPRQAVPPLAAVPQPLPPERTGDP